MLFDLYKDQWHIYTQLFYDFWEGFLLSVITAPHCTRSLSRRIENGYPGAVESNPRLCSLGRELVENGGRHKLRKKRTDKVYTTSATEGDERLYCEEKREKGEEGRRNRLLRV